MKIKDIVFRLKISPMLIIVGKINNSFNWKFGNVFKVIKFSFICWSFIDGISLRRQPEGILFLFLFISYNLVTNLIFYSSYLMVFKFYSYYTYFNCNQYLWWRVTVAYEKKIVMCSLICAYMTNRGGIVHACKTLCILLLCRSHIVTGIWSQLLNPAFFSGFLACILFVLVGMGGITQSTR